MDESGPKSVVQQYEAGQRRSAEIVPCCDSGAPTPETSEAVVPEGLGGASVHKSRRAARSRLWPLAATVTMLSNMAVKPGRSNSALELVGLLPGDDLHYRSILRISGATRGRMTEATGLALEQLDEVLARFVAVGLVQVDGDVVTAEPPGRVLGRLIAGETERLQEEGRQVDALRDLLPGLMAEYMAWSRPRGGAVDVHAVEGVDVARLIRSLALESTGDLLWFRPDQWRLPVARETDEAVRELIASGRRSRAIYPARVLEEAPGMVRARAEAGEQVRVVAQVRTRISVMGMSAALIPDRWGASTGRRLVVREHSLVGALKALFDNVWERGMAVPGLDAGADDPGGQRRLLLHQLTRGAKDEQIARTLGVSLRTVRRRIADIMDELGADSRFQAGAEAVRRGWL